MSWLCKIARQARVALLEAISWIAWLLLALFVVGMAFELI